MGLAVSAMFYRDHHPSWWAFVKLWKLYKPEPLSVDLVLVSSREYTVAHKLVLESPALHVLILTISFDQ